MKRNALGLGVALALGCQAVAAPKKSAEKPRVYPKIIDMTLPSTTDKSASGRLISSAISGLDFRFLRDATLAGLLQAYLGELAKAKGVAEQVRRMGDTFTATQAEESLQLQRLASRKGVAVPLDTSAVRTHLPGSVEALDGLKFDKAVIEHLVAANRLAVSAYEAGMKSQDQDIKAFVQQMLPVAKARLQLASKMAGAPERPSGVPQFRNSTPPVAN